MSDDTGNPSAPAANPAVLQAQPTEIGPGDSDLLQEWEKLMTDRFGVDISKMKRPVSKTITKCPGASWDRTDMD
jgi:hypothetical protein